MAVLALVIRLAIPVFRQQVVKRELILATATMANRDGFLGLVAVAVVAITFPLKVAAAAAVPGATRLAPTFIRLYLWVASSM
jgi:hypothetical protein